MDYPTRLQPTKDMLGNENIPKPFLCTIKSDGNDLKEEIKTKRKNIFGEFRETCRKKILHVSKANFKDAHKKQDDEFGVFENHIC